MTPSEVKLAIRRTVGVEEYLYHRCPALGCTATNVTTRHARHCTRTGHPTRVHHGLRRALAAQLRRVGALPREEDPTPFTNSPAVRHGTGAYAMDITLASGELRLGGLQELLLRASLMDLAVADPHAPCHLHRATGSSATTDGHAAAVAAARKVSHYSGTFDPNYYTLRPMPVETFGRRSQDAEAFFWRDG
jgi:hypothetical protein